MDVHFSQKNFALLPKIPPVCSSLLCEAGRQEHSAAEQPHRHIGEICNSKLFLSSLLSVLRSVCHNLFEMLHVQNIQACCRQHSPQSGGRARKKEERIMKRFHPISSVLFAAALCFCFFVLGCSQETENPVTTPLMPEPSSPEPTDSAIKENRISLAALAEEGISLEYILAEEESFEEQEMMSTPASASTRSNPGVSLSRYCSQNHGAYLTRWWWQKAPFSWKCKKVQWVWWSKNPIIGYYDIDMNKACRQQHPSKPRAYLAYWSQYGWRCK